MKKFFGLIVILTLLLCSCSSYKSIIVEDLKISTFKLESTSKMRLGLKAHVENPTRATFELVDVSGVVYKGDMPFAEIVLLDNSVVSPYYDGEIPINCRIILTDPMAVLVMGLDIKSWNIGDFKLNLKVTVKKGAIKKSFKMNNISLEKLVKKFKL